MRGDLRACKDLHGEKTLSSKGLFNLVETGRTRNNDWKLKPDTFNLKIRHKFLSVTAINHWNELPWKMVDCPSSDISKLRLAAVQDYAKHKLLDSLWGKWIKFSGL